MHKKSYLLRLLDGESPVPNKLASIAGWLNVRFPFKDHLKFWRIKYSGDVSELQSTLSAKEARYMSQYPPLVVVGLRS